MSLIDLGTPFSIINAQDIPAAVDFAFNTLQDQLNGQPQLNAVSTTSPLPQTNPGDVNIGLNANGNLEVSQDIGNGLTPFSQDTVQSFLQFTPPTTGTGLPTSTQFPTSGSWGFYTDTSTGDLYLAVNQNGSIVTTALS
jgi:hypothetical protein